MQNILRPSPYLENLQSNSEQFQIAIESLLEKYKAQPVGNGYIDLILNSETSLNLISELSELPVAVERLTWWCHVTPETKLKFGCPHGMGGPLNENGEGRFSECVQYPDFAVFELPNSIDENLMSPEIFVQKCNKLVENYIKNVFPSVSFYSPCLFFRSLVACPKQLVEKILPQLRIELFRSHYLSSNRNIHSYMQKYQFQIQNRLTKPAQQRVQADVLPRSVSRHFSARTTFSVSSVGSRGNTQLTPTVGQPLAKQSIFEFIMKFQRTYHA